MPPDSCATILFSFFAYWYLPQSASTAHFLTPAQKSLAYHRMAIDSSSTVNEKYSYRDSFTIFKHPPSCINIAIEI